MKQTILTFYQFADLPDFEEWKPHLIKIGEKNNIVGTIVLAREGINATISGTTQEIEVFLSWIRKDSRFTKMNYSESISDRTTFYRLKVNLRREIVTLGDPSVKPSELVGQHIEPEEWNSLTSDPEIALIDTRNDYEIALGTFTGAQNPKTKSFREWPAFVERSLKNHKKTKVAMFCTGGIRCEKASSHLLRNGFEEVYHLRGGILNYLHKISPEKSKWHGECFLFDHRVSVTHGLVEGEARLCFGCRWPLKTQDLSSSKYEEGVSCPHCFDSLTSEKRTGLRERNKQVVLARRRNTSHIGLKMPESI